MHARSQHLVTWFGKQSWLIKRNLPCSLGWHDIERNCNWLRWIHSLLILVYSQVCELPWEREEGIKKIAPESHTLVLVNPFFQKINSMKYFMNLLKRKGSGRKKGLRYLYISNFYQSYLNCYLTIKSYFNRSSNCIVRKNITKIYSKFKSRSDSQQSVVIRFALLLVNHYWIFSSKKEKILVISNRSWIKRFFFVYFTFSRIPNCLNCVISNYGDW
jgi:hypothetical protein